MQYIHFYEILNKLLLQTDWYTVRPNKKETRFISEISSLPRKIETNCMLHYQEHFLFFHLIPNT